jgi:hypothetical protein
MSIGDLLRQMICNNVSFLFLIYLKVSVNCMEDTEDTEVVEVNNATVTVTLLSDVNPLEDMEVVMITGGRVRCVLSRTYFFKVPKRSTSKRES